MTSHVEPPAIAGTNIFFGTVLNIITFRVFVCFVFFLRLISIVQSCPFKPFLSFWKENFIATLCIANNYFYNFYAKKWTSRSLSKILNHVCLLKYIWSLMLWYYCLPTFFCCKYYMKEDKLCSWMIETFIKSYFFVTLVFKALFILVFGRQDNLLLYLGLPKSWLNWFSLEYESVGNLFTAS